MKTAMKMIDDAISSERRGSILHSLPERISNNHEGEVRRILEADGYKVFKGGWPDFLCYKPSDGIRDAEVLLVEAKGFKDQTSIRQDRFFAVLKKYLNLTVIIKRPQKK